MPLTKITGNLIAGGSGSLVDADTVDGLNVSSTNVVSTIVARDASGDFAARNIAAQDLTLSGNLTVNGTTTTINSATLTVDDKNIELGSSVAQSGLTGTITSSSTVSTVTGIVSTAGILPGMTVSKTIGTGSFGTATVVTSVDSSTQITVTGTSAQTAGSITFNTGGVTDLTASGGGITLKGASDKTFQWIAGGAAWTSSENINLPTGKTYQINGSNILSSSTHIGTTSIALNRASGNLGLTGILSIAMPGSGSGTVSLTPAAAAGTATAIIIPATSGTLITTGDSQTVTNTMLAGSIADSKLSQITTAGKVANSATTATNANTASAIVARDASGNFTATTITAALNGNASTASAVSAVAGSGSNVVLVSATMSSNDYFRIMVGPTGGDNTGYAEIATADNGTEPIYVRQYTGAAGNFNTLQRTLTLLDESGNTDVPGQLKAAKGTTTGVTAVAALNIDCSLGTFFTKTIAANSTFTVSNVPAAGTAYGFTLELTVSAGSVTWWSGVIWPSAITPTLAAGKTHLLIFVTDDGGTVWRGSFLTDYAS